MSNEFTGSDIIMNEENTPPALSAIQVTPRIKPSNYPEPFASRMLGREKRSLGDFFVLQILGLI